MTRTIFTGAFWKAAGERAAKAFAWSLSAMLTGGVMDIVEMPWWAGTRIALGAAALSLLGSIVSSEATGGGPSATNAERLPLARGGPIKPGQVYIVGEHAPEVLQVPQSGHVYPTPHNEGNP